MFASMTFRRLAITAFVLAGVSAYATRVGAQAPNPFEAIARVLQHPRCVNCHPSDNRPLQGDDHHLHQMMVNRGSDGRGSVGARCYACHQDHNSDLSIVPGAPHWQLAPASMAWFGLSSGDLCRVLKDPARNGNRSLADLIEHMDKDPLVLWGWSPGRGRAPIPIAHTEFITLLKAWATTGGDCP